MHQIESIQTLVIVHKILKIFNKVIVLRFHVFINVKIVETIVIIVVLAIIIWFCNKIIHNINVDAKMEEIILILIGAVHAL